MYLQDSLGYRSSPLPVLRLPASIRAGEHCRLNQYRKFGLFSLERIELIFRAPKNEVKFIFTFASSRIESKPTLS